jgi:hypothetical protein
VLWWALAAALGGVVGLGLTAGAAGALAATPLLPPVQQFILSFLSGLLLGTVQWLVLHDYLPQLGWGEWALYTAVSAGIIGFFFPAVLAGLDLSALAGTAPANGTALWPPDPALVALAVELLRRVAPAIVIGGALTGLAQWIVLRQYVRGAAWWIPTSALGSPLGLFVGVLGAGLLGVGVGLGLAAAGRLDVLSNTLGELLLGLAGGAVVETGVALVTAPVLLWLVRRAYPPASSS